MGTNGVNSPQQRRALEVMSRLYDESMWTAVFILSAAGKSRLVVRRGLKMLGVGDPGLRRRDG